MTESAGRIYLTCEGLYLPLLYAGVTRCEVHTLVKRRQEFLNLTVVVPPGQCILNIAPAFVILEILQSLGETAGEERRIIKDLNGRCATVHDIEK